MRYDSEADFERALMSIDHVVKSTLAKRANRGVEREQMDADTLIGVLSPKLPPDVSGVIFKSIKYAWDLRDMYKIQLMANARNVLKRFGITHPKLEEAARLWASATPSQKQEASVARAERQRKLTAARTRKAAQKRQKLARRKQRSREDEFVMSAFA
jgi:hypothetical protein